MKLWNSGFNGTSRGIWGRYCASSLERISSENVHIVGTGPPTDLAAEISFLHFDLVKILRARSRLQRNRRLRRQKLNPVGYCLGSKLLIRNEAGAGTGRAILERPSETW